MKTYARIDGGTVIEIILPQADEEGGEIGIEDRFAAEFVETLVDISGINPAPNERWTYDGSTFAPPVVHQSTSEEIKAANTSTRDHLLEQAGLAIAPLQDAVDLDDATPEETALLKKWKQYRVAVNRIDLTQERPTWPQQS